jgi:hypothetical protein
MTETTEKIVESYFRYCRDCATMTNIKCSAQHEIDLLAVDLRTGTRYHVESSVNIGAGFSKLTNKPFDPMMLKDRNKGPDMRRTLGFFDQVKFSAQDVVSKLAEYGFQPGAYSKVVVTWDCSPEVTAAAANVGIEVLEFPTLLTQFQECVVDKCEYIMDDTVRMLQLLARVQKMGKSV